MTLCKRKISVQALSLVEILIVIFLFSTSILLVIRLYPAIFMLNKKTDDLVTAKNLTEELFQTLKGEVNTKVLIFNNTSAYPSGVAANTICNKDPYYRNSSTSIPINNIVNPRKCFWQLVALTEDPNGNGYTGNFLDTYLIANNNTSNNKFQERNPSRYEPADPNSNDWIATYQFWNQWKIKVEKSLPVYDPTSAQRASATVAATYIYTDPNTNVFKKSRNDYTNYGDFKNIIDDGSTNPVPSIQSSKYMVEVTVCMYWRSIQDKSSGTYTRNLNTPNYKLSTLIIPPLDSAVKQN
ncbi:MAG: hypothetical protein ABRQ38_21170 [Candidatus Eremiobacterota bacterium]